MLGQKCKVCGREMEMRTGEHYQNTSTGRHLYKYVKQYVCPIGCPGAYFDFSKARPVDQLDRLFYVIPVPDREVNLIDPLLIGGLGFFYLMFIGGIIALNVGIGAKLISIVVITAFAFLLYRFMGETSENGNGEEAG